MQTAEHGRKTKHQVCVAVHLLSWPAGPLALCRSGRSACTHQSLGKRPPRRPRERPRISGLRAKPHPARI
eukprot:14534649-Alexandrium_andersonii.AAC.1